MLSSGSIVTGNGRPLRVRVDGGIPLSMLPGMCEEARMNTRIFTGTREESSRDERAGLIGAENPKEAKVIAPPGSVVVLCVAIAIFLSMTAGVIAMLIWVQRKVEDVSDQLAEDGTPSLSTLIKHIEAILNHTEVAALQVEGMAHQTASLLTKSVSVANHALNVSDDIVGKVSTFSKTPALTLLGGVG